MRLYFSLRILLYAAFFSIAGVIGYSFLFPSQEFIFDFRNPDAAKNTLLDPRDAQGSEQRNGIVEENKSLTVSSGALGIFSDATISVRLKKDSPIPNTPALLARKGYREIFLPEGKPAEFPVWKDIRSLTFEGYKNGGLFRIEENVYQFFDGKFYRFVSDNAVLSRYSESDIIEQTPEFLSSFPLADEWIGFRPGTLLSFADGVFAVYGETDIRPIGSAEIFQAIGYNFDDVIKASEEEIGMYKRGKIIIPGTLHAPGTLFQIIETLPTGRQAGAYFTLDSENYRRPITDPTLLQFFLKRTHAIPVSEKSRMLSSNCVLTPGIIFSREYTCDFSLLDMRDLPGSDYQFTLMPGSKIDMESIDIILKRSPEKGNFRSTLSQIKARLLERYSK